MLRIVFPTLKSPDVAGVVQDVVDTPKVEAGVDEMRFYNFSDIAVDSVIVGDVDAAIAAKRCIAVEFVPAEILPSRQLTDRRGRKAQRR